MIYFVYLILFLIPLVISVIMLPLLVRLAKRLNLMDISIGDDLKIHKLATPLLGGGAMIFSFVIGFVFFYFYKNFFTQQLWGIILASLVVFSLGFWDDLKWKHYSKTRPIVKFIFLIIVSFLAALILFLVNIRINFFAIPALAFFLNFIYIFIFINALNYQDGMDGLAAGLAAISLVAFIFVGFAHGSDLSLYFSFVILGGVTGFLFFNFPPAKIFMGDSGAYFLGFILMILTALHIKSFNFLSLLGTIFIVGIPLFDGVFTNLRRIMKGKSIFRGDRDHFYDILFKKNNSQVKTIFISFAIQAALATIGVLLLTI